MPGPGPMPLSLEWHNAKTTYHEKFRVIIAVTSRTLPAFRRTLEYKLQKVMTPTFLLPKKAWKTRWV